MRTARTCTRRTRARISAYARRVWSTGSAALCLCCLRHKTTSANMWPDLGGRVAVRGCGPRARSRGFHRRGDFSGDGFYCPRTRASCWNSKRSSRRDIIPGVHEGNGERSRKKGGGEGDDGGGCLTIPFLCAPGTSPITADDRDFSLSSDTCPSRESHDESESSRKEPSSVGASDLSSALPPTGYHHRVVWCRVENRKYAQSRELARRSLPSLGLKIARP